MTCPSGHSPEVTVAQVLKVFLPEYLDRYALAAHHLKVLRHLAQLIMKSPLFAGHSHCFLHPARLALPSLSDLVLDVGCWVLTPPRVLATGGRMPACARTLDSRLKASP
jgi:hypothetical protein